MPTNKKGPRQEYLARLSRRGKEDNNEIPKPPLQNPIRTPIQEVEVKKRAATRKKHQESKKGKENTRRKLQKE